MATGICRTVAYFLESRGTVVPILWRILNATFLSSRPMITVTTGTGPLFGRSKVSVDLILNSLVAVFLQGPPSSWLSLSDLLIPVLGFFYFLEIAIGCSPVIMYRLLPTKRGNLK